MSNSLNDKYIYYLCYKEKLKEEHGTNIYSIIDRMDNNVANSIYLAIGILDRYSYEMKKDNKDEK
ncbi:MAG TPA: hypothetical protein ACHBX0_13540 [Arsenophonus sp.]